MTFHKPKLVVPAGATDTHIHIYLEDTPAAPGGPPIPGHFPVEKYREIQRHLGLKRVIVVQPNAYQDDNRVTLEAIRALGPGAKSVGVVKPGVSDAEIERLTKGGIVAQRIFQLPWGVVGFDRMHEVMARVHSFGWFANVQLDGRDLPRQPPRPSAGEPRARAHALGQQLAASVGAERQSAGRRRSAGFAA